MNNYYFNPNHPLKPYTHTLPATEGTLPPSNATRDKQPTIVQGCWPCWDGAEWVQVEDHRKRDNSAEVTLKFGKDYPQDGTPYWIPSDTHYTPARKMDDIGPLPDGALLERPALPEPTQEERNAQRRTEILARLSEIDFESARPLRAIVEDKATQDDKSKLTALEAEAELLRVELATIPK